MLATQQGDQRQRRGDIESAGGNSLCHRWAERRSRAEGLAPTGSGYGAVAIDQPEREPYGPFFFKVSNCTNPDSCDPVSRSRANLLSGAIQEQLPLSDIRYAGPADTNSIGSISDFAGNGFVR